MKNTNQIDELPSVALPSRAPAARFDETTVAMARPVQPLRDRRQRAFGLSSSLIWWILVIAFYGVAITSVLVAGSKLRVASDDATVATTANPQDLAQPTDTAASANDSPADISEDSSGARPRLIRHRSVRRPARVYTLYTQNVPMIPDQQGRPVARLVGIIHGRP